MSTMPIFEVERSALRIDETTTAAVTRSHRPLLLLSSLPRALRTIPLESRASPSTIRVIYILNAFPNRPRAACNVDFMNFMNRMKDFGNHDQIQVGTVA